MVRPSVAGAGEESCACNAGQKSETTQTKTTYFTTGSLYRAGVVASPARWRTRPQRLKPCSKQCSYRSGERFHPITPKSCVLGTPALRHPKQRQDRVFPQPVTPFAGLPERWARERWARERWTREHGAQRPHFSLRLLSLWLLWLRVEGRSSRAVRRCQ